MRETPVMSQYRRLKQEVGDAILFFRMGDFYEMFFEDAVQAARILDLTLTSRDKQSPDPVPMAGVPWHSAEPYVARLLQAGRRVALCEQVERPGTRGLMEREIVEILTPGTPVTEGLLQDAQNVYLGALAPQRDAWGLALADVSTGEFSIGELPAEGALAELERFAPRELLLPEEAARDAALAPFLKAHPEIVRTPLDAWLFSPRRGRDLLQEQYGVQTLEPFGMEGLSAGLAAAGALLAYAHEQRRSSLAHLRPPRAIRSDDALQLDESTLRNLEILEPLSGRAPSSLLGVLDATRTALGARALRRALARPFTSLEAIGARHARVAAFCDAADRRQAVREALRGVADLERLLARVHCGRASARDLGRLRDSLQALPLVLEAMRPLVRAGCFGELPSLDPLDDLREDLTRALNETARLVRDEERVCDGYDAELDRARGLARDGEAWIAAMQAREREATGISSLKVGYNQVFGYYLEVTRANLSRVPPGYERKQTLVGAERFVTPELREWEARIASAREDAQGLQAQLLERLRERVRERTAGLQALAAAIAEWDLAAAFATRAVEQNYVRPVMHAGDRIRIVDGRHPVVERLLDAETFVPNDVDLDARLRQIQIITGPNMAGKSTYLRQVGLIVLMAQAGSFVPAREAEIGIADRIFTRVGASDNIARGQSTFLVEMIETSRILHGATSRSLVLLDEIGRGTSTYDGLAIAWAVAEHLRREPLRRPRTLFATHFHELTVLGWEEPGYVNLNILVKEWHDRIVFVRRVAEGAADRSYGIQVARLAGLPEALLERARAILAELEAHGRHGRDGGGGGGDEPQIPLFGAAGARGRRPEGPGAESTARDELAQAIANLALDRLSGLEALRWLEQWQQRLRPAAPPGDAGGTAPPEGEAS
jgi:DNA mismatch repair protein MutS